MRTHNMGGDRMTIRIPDEAEWYIIIGIILFFSFVAIGN